MIKLIASDLDGTLVDDKKSLDAELFPMLDDIIKDGVIFSAASGRHITSLSAIFKDYAEDMLFIAGNGAYVMYQNRELYSSPMAPALVSSILSRLEDFPSLEPFLESKGFGYTMSPHSKQVMESPFFNYKVRLVDDLYSVQDDIIKISVVNKNGPISEIFDKLCPVFGDTCKLEVSGYANVDIVNNGVSKGAAIDIIQGKLGILPEETAVFGDNYNDVSMFSRAYYSFAMKNAEDGVKKHARFSTSVTNNEGGVVKEIKRLLKYNPQKEV